MDARGLKARGLQSAAGVSKSMIYSILNGEQSPSVEVLEKIASGLRVPVWTLLCPPDIAALILKGDAISLLEAYGRVSPDQQDLILRLALSQIPGTQSANAVNA